jgi:hypothetical protein
VSDALDGAAERPEDAGEVRLADLLRLVVIAMVRRDGRDLSARQLGIFLICYLDEEAYKPVACVC